MASKKSSRTRKSRNTRPVQSYLESAKSLNKLVPSLTKYKRRKTLKPHEKAAISRYEKLLRFASNLVPVDANYAKARPFQLYKPVKKQPIDAIGEPEHYPTTRGIRAVQLRNTDPETAIVRPIGEADTLVINNGRYWLLWRLDRETVRSRSAMKEAAEAAFTMSEQFPIEDLLALATAAFKNINVLAIALWTRHGRVGETFLDLQSFNYWIMQKWHKYKDTDRWIEGIYVLVGQTPDYDPKREERYKPILPSNVKKYYRKRKPTGTPAKKSTKRSKRK